MVGERTDRSARPAEDRQPAVSVAAAPDSLKRIDRGGLAVTPAVLDRDLSIGREERLDGPEQRPELRKAVGGIGKDQIEPLLCRKMPGEIAWQAGVQFLHSGESRPLHIPLD